MTRLRIHDAGPGRGAIAVWMISLAFLLAGCTERDTARRGAAHPSAQIQSVYVATTRDLDRTGPAFGFSRSGTLNAFRVDVSVPPTHEVGQIEWAPATRKPDARTDFVVTGTQVYDSLPAMVRKVQSATSGRETMVFVHGYNNTLSEAMYRLVQIRTDFGAREPSVMFSWPSAGDARGYAYDRDSILFARDDMEKLLQALTAAPGEKLFLLAHSMGSHLTMEVLRQAALKGDRRLLDRISGVVLISPDIDPDLFRRQVAAIGKLPQPFFIFASRQDRALTLSGLITGRKQRLGVIDGPDEVKGLNVKLIDFTSVSDSAGMNHFTPVTSPVAVRMLRGLLSQPEAHGDWMGDYIVLDKQP